jgi:type I restriction enzyme S subunit
VQVIRGTNISDTRKLIGEMVCITPQLADQLGNAIVYADDLVFPHRGSIGLVGIVPRNNVERYALSSSLMKLTCDRRQVEPLFLFYFFRSDEGRHELLKNASTVGTPGIGQPLSSLRSIKVPLPPLAEQKAIAAVLGALDDKIDLNRRMNATLEAMARALFQSWFVDFDPVRAKLDGRPPAGIDPSTAALFPEHLEESPLGHIPKGWKAGTVVEAFKLTMGQSPPGDTYNEEGNGLPFYQGRTDFGFRFPTRRIYCSAPTRYAKPGDTLVSVRAPVGNINMANEECCIGRGVAAVRHKSGATSFTYHSMANLYPDFARFEAEGTVFGSINKDSFEKLPFVIPPTKIVAAYERQAGPLDEQIRTIENQSRTLATLRDTLLPKLLSGELNVSALEVAR